MQKRSIILFISMVIITLSVSCSQKENTQQKEMSDTVVPVVIEKTPEEIQLEQDIQKLISILEVNNPFNNTKGEASMLTQNILANKEAFLHDLAIVLKKDREMASLEGEYSQASYLLRTDKQVRLQEGYVPPHLVDLTKESGDAGNYVINRLDLALRDSVEKELSKMATLAAQEGITFLVSSSYRSEEYQAIVFDRNVKNYGLEMAERDSARPGRSQHQLGTVIDFGSITNDFYDTKAGIWIYENGPGLGWSLSFPPEYESVTGYVWESWHWRYIGVEAVKFQEKWFKNIQQYMIEFVHAWQTL